MHRFKAVINIIGINPFVFVPDKILKNIFKEAGKDKGHIPVHGTINGVSFTQTLVRYSGHYRLYINTKMLPNSPKRIGEAISVEIAFDPAERTIRAHPKLLKALKENKDAGAVFNSLAPSRQKEIVRYIASLKSEESVERNVNRAIAFLTGKARFVGRAQP